MGITTKAIRNVYGAGSGLGKMAIQWYGPEITKGITAAVREALVRSKTVGDFLKKYSPEMREKVGKLLERPLTVVNWGPYEKYVDAVANGVRQGVQASGDVQRAIDEGIRQAEKDGAKPEVVKEAHRVKNQLMETVKNAVGEQQHKQLLAAIEVLEAVETTEKERDELRKKIVELEKKKGTLLSKEQWKGVKDALKTAGTWADERARGFGNGVRDVGVAFGNGIGTVGTGLGQAIKEEFTLTPETKEVWAEAVAPLRAVNNPHASADAAAWLRAKADAANTSREALPTGHTAIRPFSALFNGAFGRTRMRILRGIGFGIVIVAIVIGTVMLAVHIIGQL